MKIPLNIKLSSGSTVRKSEKKIQIENLEKDGKYAKQSIFL